MRLTTETKNYYENKINFYEEWYDTPSFIWKQHQSGTYPLHFHSAIEIYFILEGKITTSINGIKYTFYAGDISVVNPYEPHAYLSEESAYTAVLIVSSYYLADFQKEYTNKTLPNCLCDKEFNKQIYALLQDIPSSIYDNTSLSILGKKGITNLVLDKIISHYGVISQSHNEEMISNILKYIHKNYDNKITLDTLAEEFGYAKNSMSRILRKYLSVDLRVFVNNIRAEQVKLLLTNPNYNHLSILQIAHSCGFESAATFYRTYKRLFGELPPQRK